MFYLDIKTTNMPDEKVSVRGPDQRKKLCIVATDTIRCFLLFVVLINIKCFNRGKKLFN